MAKTNLWLNKSVTYTYTVNVIIIIIIIKQERRFSFFINYFARDEEKMFNFELLAIVLSNFRLFCGQNVGKISPFIIKMRKLT